MTVLLITALQAAEMLAAYHRQRVDQTLGARQQWPAEMARLCEENAEDIRRQLAVGATPENQARAVRSRDVEIAQLTVAAHLLPEWRASDNAPQAMEGLAQATVDAVQTARGGTTGATAANYLQIAFRPGYRFVVDLRRGN
jgi:hypothetical protein